MVAAKTFGFQKLDARRLLAQGSQFVDLVFGASDLRLSHLHQAEFFAVVDRDTTNDVDHSLAIFQRATTKFLERSRVRQ